MKLVNVVRLVALLLVFSLGSTWDSATAEAADPTSQLQKTMAEQLIPLKIKYQQRINEYGENHPSVVLLAKQITVIEQELKKLQLLGASATAEPKDRETLKKLVTQIFELQMKVHADRLARAEAEITAIKKELKERQQKAPQIIDRQVDQLLGSRAGKASELDDKDMPVSLLTAEGWEALRERDLRTALSKFQIALEKDSDDHGALNGRGWALLHLGDYDEAIVEFERTLKLVPTHGGSMNGLAQCLMLQGKHEESKERFTDAVESLIKAHGSEEAVVKRHVGAAWIGLVRLLIEMKQFEEAKQWANRYLKHDKDMKIMKALAEEAEDGLAARPDQSGSKS